MHREERGSGDTDEGQGVVARKSIVVGGVEVEAGSVAQIDIPVSDLYTHTPVTMPVHVTHGRRSGPVAFVSAAIHGDEINGVEIIHRLLRLKALKRLAGTLICIPVVNVFGFLNQTRYLPDGRDLNRSFPGSEKGSLAARLASVFLKEIASHCEYGIDLHTGSWHRTNLPQIRANLDDEVTIRLARAFHVPVLINSNLRDGSLRQAADEMGITMLVYEGGERLRFNESVIRAGVYGVLNVLRTLEMLRPSRRSSTFPDPLVANGSGWVRAPGSGIFRVTTELGLRVRKDDVLGVISDPFGANEQVVQASFSGIVIGQNNLPLINEGDALFHIARFDSAVAAAENVEAFHEAIGNADPLAPQIEPPSY